MAFRLWYTSVSGFPRSWLTTHMPCANDPLSPRHTGRADFPHPAFPDTFAAGVRKRLTAAQRYGISRPRSANSRYHVDSSGLR